MADEQLIENVEEPLNLSNDATEPVRTSGMNAVMMPWFMGASWVPKFSGGGGAVKFSQWRAQVESFLRAQMLNPQQRVDFLLSTLDGSAHREAMLLPHAERDSDQILQALSKKYGDHRSVETLREEYFDCKQAVGEGIDDFILRLRECYYRWQTSDPSHAEPIDGVLRSQFSRGLKEGPVKQELQRHLRRTPNLTFDAVCREAKFLENEGKAQVSEAMACQTRAAPPPSVPETQSQLNLQQLKESLRAELKQEIHDQVTLLGKTIVDEIRGQFSNSQPDHAPTSQWSRPAAPPPPNRRRRPDTQEPRDYQWDNQGRPICRDCGEAGHVQRYCPRRPTSTQGFQPLRSLQGE